MPRKNLKRGIIVAEAIKLINANGYANFSLQSLSRHLDIKAPSLYTHFRNLDEIAFEVFKELINGYNEFKVSRVGELKKEEAVKAYAYAIREYSQTYPEQFKFLLFCPSVLHNKIEAPINLDILMSIFDQFNLGEQEKYHFQRAFRGLVNGFIGCEKVGFFFNKEVNVDDSFEFAVQMFIATLMAEEAKAK